MAPSPSARGTCKVSSTELRRSSPPSASRPRPGSLCEPDRSSGSCEHPAEAAQGTTPAPSGSTCQWQRLLPPNWARTWFTRQGASCHRGRVPAAQTKLPRIILSLLGGRAGRRRVELRRTWSWLVDLQLHTQLTLGRTDQMKCIQVESMCPCDSLQFVRRLIKKGFFGGLDFAPPQIYASRVFRLHENASEG
ncbi:hypothetical protein LEMLEM_LOCUS7130 [Lemmus lemmus]